MPIVSSPSDGTPPEQPNPPHIAAPQYRGVTVDTRYIPNTALMTHVEGSSWTVNYYSQVLDTDSALAGQNVARNAIYQQYKLIKGFELKVTGPLTTSQDPASKSMSVTGSANVYPFVIPNEGDMFLADIGDGREGIFRVTSSERRAIYKETAHFIEYQLIDYSTDVRRGDLNSKVIQTLQFVRDFLQYGQNPLLEEEDYANIRKLRGHYEDMAHRYFKSFLSNEYKTLLLPGQADTIYDHFLTTAVLAFFTSYDDPAIRQVRKLNVDGDDVMKCTTLWDALRSQDIKLLKHCNRQAGLVSARTFERNPLMEGIYHSGIRYVVYPRDPELSVDYTITPRVKLLEDQKLTDSPSQVRRLADLLSDRRFNGLTRPDAPPIHRVAEDDYYVLSKAFYDDEPTQSLLEITVRQFLERKALDNKALLTLCEAYHSWGGLERFYYVPIILILIKSSIRSI